jgi:hypothetical protein
LFTKASCRCFCEADFVAFSERAVLAECGRGAERKHGGGGGGEMAREQLYSTLPRRLSSRLPC